jgi:N-acetylglucosaminyldiphosphoundecaprenol N-acetyl-beta-D-mannosaminyltransferase
VIPAVSALEDAAPCRRHAWAAEADRARLVNRARIDAITPGRFLAAIESFLECDRAHVVHFCAAYTTVVARKDSAYREALNRADLNVPDGMPLAWALNAFGRQTVRLAGSDGMALLCDVGRRRNVRHFFLGGKATAVERLEVELHRTYPGIQIAGRLQAPFRQLTDDELTAIDRAIRLARADVVWVGNGTPLQEFLAADLRRRGSAPVILCVGAAFDFVSGGKRRAPRWMQRAGLEWLHRLGCEPRRLCHRYLVGNALFVGGVGLDYVRSRHPGR